MAQNSKTATDLKAKYTKGTQSKTVGKLSNIDPYGFERPENFDYKAYEDFESEYLAVLAHRTMRWDRMMKNGTKSRVKHDRTIKRFCRKGIPERYRTLVWMEVSGAQKKLKNHPGLYHSLLSNPSNDEADADAVLLESIKIDLDRTFPDNIYFKNGSQEDKKQALSNVLTAYGRHNTSVGYCQGMNYITALLLIVVKDEEKAFWLLESLIGEILPPYYSNHMTALRAEMGVLSDLVRQKYFSMQDKMESTNTPWMLIASKWFICLYVDVLPTETVLRIWDCIFFEGSKVLFRVALTIIHQRLTTVANCRSLDEIITTFKDVHSDATALDCHQFMNKCFSVPNPLSTSEITKLRLVNVELIEKEEKALNERRQ